MLKIDDAILVNKYGQGLIDNEILLSIFSAFKLEEKRNYLKEIIALIIQSKPKEEDIDLSIAESALKPTFTPCVILKKGIANHHLQKIVELPESELTKSLLLLLALFSISYQRRFRDEKNHPNKWWYWDLSKEENVRRVISNDI